MIKSIGLVLLFVAVISAADEENVKISKNRSVEKSQIRFHLYTRASPTEGTVIETELFDGTINDANFNPALPMLFFVHGWTKSHVDWTMTTIRDTIWRDTDAQVNIFHADWYGPAHLFYTHAVQSLPEVGAIMGEFINKLQTKYEIPATKVNLYGASVGGQLVGVIGHALKGQVNQIISADPAWPLFDRDDLSLRLDPSDAFYVQVIHTNARFMSTMTPLGHVDFYPNGGGMNQPGCGIDLLLVCAHDRAVVYYAESLVSGHKLLATKCDTYDDFTAGNCAGNERLSLGGLYPDQSVSGTYYLNTASEKPFGLG